MAKAKRRPKGKPQARASIVGGMMFCLEWLCNVFLFLVPSVVVIWSSYLWFTSGKFKWLALTDLMRSWKLRIPEKLSWGGMNDIYHYALTSPLVLVSVVMGLSLLALGSSVALVTKRSR